MMPSSRNLRPSAMASSTEPPLESSTTVAPRTIAFAREGVERGRRVGGDGAGRGDPGPACGDRAFGVAAVGHIGERHGKLAQIRRRVGVDAESGRRHAENGDAQDNGAAQDAAETPKGLTTQVEISPAPKVHHCAALDVFLVSLRRIRTFKNRNCSAKFASSPTFFP